MAKTKENIQRKKKKSERLSKLEFVLLENRHLGGNYDRGT